MRVNRSLKMIFMTCSCLWATLMMASCLNDEEEDTVQNLTEQQMAAERAALAGRYDGQLFVGDTRSQADSVAMHVSISDTMLVSRDFPVGRLVDAVSNAADGKILAAASPQLFEASVIPTVIDVDGYYGYYVIPTTASCAFDVTTSDGIGHSVKIRYKSYLQDANYSYQPIAIYGVESREVMVNILIQSITIDSNTYQANQVLSFVGTK